jgi:cytoskeletal protein CcmA (bactofilin family)
VGGPGRAENAPGNVLRCLDADPVRRSLLDFRDVRDSGVADPLIGFPLPKQWMFVMAIWKEPTTTTKEAAVLTPEPAVKREPEHKNEHKVDHKAEYKPDLKPEHAADIAPSAARRPAPREAKESIIAADITIAGKIDGSGHVRIAGRFEGDVNIQGDLTIDAGAKLTGSVRANSVTIGGEVEGNIESAASVELLTTGVLNGDLKGGTLTVAAGSRMRGRVEFGWGEELLPGKATLSLGSRQAS